MRPPATQAGLIWAKHIRLCGYKVFMKDEAQIFKALADETRLRILALLSRGELCVCDLMAVLKLPQSTVSRHLAYLRNAGWLHDRREGVWMYYRLAGRSESLHVKLLPILEEYLAATRQGIRDAEALKRHAKQDSGSSCG